MSTNLSVIFVLCVIFAEVFAQEAQGPKDPGLIQHVTPNFKAVKGLICYQCHSITSELQPLCDQSIFRLATPQEKYNMSLQCPHYQGAYCFMKVIKNGKYVETTRGCSGPRDKNGHLMKVGCMTTQNVKLCLCDKKFCNAAVPTFSGMSLIIFLAIFVIYN